MKLGIIQSGRKRRIARTARRHYRVRGGPSFGDPKRADEMVDVGRIDADSSSGEVSAHASSVTASLGDASADWVRKVVGSAFQGQC